MTDMAQAFALGMQAFAAAGGFGNGGNQGLGLTQPTPLDTGEGM